MKFIVGVAFVALSAVVWGAFYTINKKKIDNDIKEFNNNEIDSTDEEFKEEAENEENNY